MFSPLDQFDVFVIGLWSFPGLTVYVTNIVLYLVFLIFLVIIFRKFVLKYNMYIVVPTMMQIMLEKLYKNLFVIFKQQVGVKGEKYFPLFLSVFIFILFSNLLGLLPFGFTITAHLVVTFSLALSFNIGFIFLGFYLHGLSFLKLFKPAGTPMYLAPLIILIEIVSYLIRSFSLSIRLFANMMAGHCLLYVISSFFITFVISKSLIGMISISFIFIIVYGIVFVLEFGIAFLQAYVFFILLSIYLSDSLKGGH